MTLALIVGTLAGGILAIPLFRWGVRLEAPQAARLVQRLGLAGAALLGGVGYWVVKRSYPALVGDILVGLPLAAAVILALLVLREKSRNWMQVLHSVAGLFAAGIIACELLLATAALGLLPARFPQLLFQIGGHRAGYALAASARDTDPEVKAAALAIIKDCRPVPLAPIQAAVTDPNASVRARAVYALRAHPDPSSVPMLLTAMRDSDSSVRSAARYYFQDHFDERAVTPLLLAMAATQDRQDLTSVSTFIRNVVPQVLPVLVRHLKSEEASIREAAVVALGMSADASAVQPVVAALRDRELRVRVAAAESLGEIAKSASDEQMRLVQAIRYGEQVSPPSYERVRPPDLTQVLRGLAGAIRDVRLEVRLAAAKALSTGFRRSHNWNGNEIYLADRESGLFAPPTDEVVPALVAALKDPSVDLQRAAGLALEHCAGRRSASALIGALPISDREVLTSVVKALGHTEDARAVAVLKQLEKQLPDHPSCDVCQSLYRLGAYGAIQHSVYEDRN